MMTPSASATSRVVEVMDGIVARILRVQPLPAAVTTTGRPFETPLLAAGVRCTLRYIVLPIVLPFLGLATGAARGIVTGAAVAVLMMLDVVAVVSVVATLRWLWRRQHPRRWPYLLIALALSVLIAVFFVNDSRVLYG